MAAIPDNILAILKKWQKTIVNSTVLLMVSKCLPNYTEYVHRAKAMKKRATDDANQLKLNDPYRTAYINYRVYKAEDYNTGCMQDALEILDAKFHYDPYRLMHLDQDYITFREWVLHDIQNRRA